MSSANIISHGASFLMSSVSLPIMMAKRNGLRQGPANFFAWRTSLSRKNFHGPALKININIQQLNFISAHITIVIQEA